MNSHWYALRSKPMKEAFLCAQLGLYNIESYCPSIQVQSVNPRARKIKPYFPGYVFGRVDLKQISISRLRWIPGLAAIVSSSGIPSHIPDEIVAAIRRRLCEINAAAGQELDVLKPGAIVSIQEGPFKGYEAILDARIPSRERVKVLLDFLDGSQVRLELPGRQISRIKQ